MAGERDLRGSTGLYTPEAAKVAEVVCEEFKASNAQIAKVLDVSPTTVAEWERKKPDFALALSRGREKQNRRVEKALYERAIGYRHPAKKIMQWQGETIEVEYVEHYPPDVNAIQFWLKNRDPQNWQDVTKSEISGPNGVPFPIINITLKAPGDKS